LGLLFA
jgi:hypothetical protein